MIACVRSKASYAGGELCADCDSQHARDIVATGFRPAYFWFRGERTMLPTTCRIGAPRTTERRLFVTEGR